jgi:Predicted transcriptional regulators
MDISEMAKVFKALGDENRLRIVNRICCNGEVCACNLLEDLDVTQPTLSHHMKLLRECGLIKARKEGRWMHYSLNMTMFTELEKALGSFC